jgi:hypothetical protein
MEAHRHFISMHTSLRHCLDCCMQECPAYQELADTVVVVLAGRRHRVLVVVVVTDTVTSTVIPIIYYTHPHCWVLVNTTGTRVTQPELRAVIQRYTRSTSNHTESTRVQ